jgi:hypothetical protein
MKKTTYLYYSPAPTFYDRRKANIPDWMKDILKIVILFLLSFIVTL